MIDQAAAAQILIDRDAALAAQRGEFRNRRARREPGDVEVAGMHAQDQARALVDGVAVIARCACGWWCRLRAERRRSAA